MARTIRKSKGRSDTLSFAGIPRVVMRHPDFLQLSASAVRLLLEFAYQYRGHNNGDLTCAWEVMRHRGWNSKATIQRARDELIAADLIRCVRHGKFLNPGGNCSLYALTWRPLDREDLDLPPTRMPLRIFASTPICKTPGPESGHGSTQILGREASGIRS